MNQSLEEPLQDSVKAAKSEPIPPPPAPSDTGAAETTPVASNPEESHFLRVIGEFKTSSETARTQHKDKWDVCWGLFNNEYDFSKKADWQSKNWIPKIPTLVRATTALIKNSIKSSKDIGRIDGYGVLSKQKAPMMNKLVMCALEKGKFVEKLIEAIMGGLLTPGVNLKIYPKSVAVDTTESTQGGPTSTTMGGYKNIIAYEAISEYDIYRDPTGRNKGHIHRFEMDLEDLKTLAEDPNNGYDLEVVNSISSDFQSQEDNYERLKRAGQTNVQRPAWRKTVLVEEYWGDINNSDGKILFRMGTMSRANEKYLIRKPMKNPFRHGKSPIISAFPAKVPFSTWHEAFVYAVTGLAIMITETMNLTLDANLFDSLRVFQIDVDKCTDPTDLMGGIWPGKVIKAEETNGRPVIQTAQMGQISPQQTVVYQSLVSELNNGAGTSEFSIPQMNPAGKRGVTATEVDQKSNQADIFTNNLAQIIEEEAIEPALQMTTELIIQYFNDFQSPEIIDLLGTDAMILAQAQSDEERIHLLGGNYKYKSQAITGIIKKYETLKQMQYVKDLVKEFPELAQFINGVEVLKDVIDVTGLDSKRYVKVPEDPEALMLEAQIQNRPSPLAGQLIEYRQKQGMGNPIEQAINRPIMGNVEQSGMEALI
jgi:hypothetical protein